MVSKSDEAKQALVNDSRKQLWKLIETIQTLSTSAFVRLFRNSGPDKHGVITLEGFTSSISNSNSTLLDIEREIYANLFNFLDSDGSGLLNFASFSILRSLTKDSQLNTQSPAPKAKPQRRHDVMVFRTDLDELFKRRSKILTTLFKIHETNPNGDTWFRVKLSLSEISSILSRFATTYLYSHDIENMLLASFPDLAHNPMTLSQLELHNEKSLRGESNAESLPKINNSGEDRSSGFRWSHKTISSPNDRPLHQIGRKALTKLSSRMREGSLIFVNS